MKQSLQLRTSQHLALTPQLQQSIRLLQLSTLELHQETLRQLRPDAFSKTYSPTGRVSLAAASAAPALRAAG